MIIINGVSFEESPRPQGQKPNTLRQWRGFRINATLAEATAAISASEVLTVEHTWDSAATDPDTGELVMETLSEEVDGYPILGGVFDWLDGTVTVWLGKQTDAEKLAASVTAYVQTAADLDAARAKLDAIKAKVQPLLEAINNSAIVKATIGRLTDGLEDLLD